MRPHLDRAALAFHLQAPIFDRPSIGLEAQKDQYGIDWQLLLFACTVIEDRRRSWPAIAMQLLQLIERLDLDWRMPQLDHAMLVGTELIAPMDQRHAFGIVLQ